MTTYELYYDEMMEGPIRARLMHLWPNSTADFEIFDAEHKRKYGSVDLPLIRRARLVKEGDKPARYDEYIYKEKSTMGGTQDEETETTTETPEEKPLEEWETRYIKAPPYGRKKADEIMRKVRQVAAYLEDHTGIDIATLNFSREEAIILHDMLYDMDKHLPDFFEQDKSGPEE